jgi:multidrug efflux pump subunit AcrA (membrane-fusion protein)
MAEAPFLDPEPPHWAARGLGRLIIALFVIAVLAAIVVRVPETVTGRFTLVPLRGTDPVRTLKEGVLSVVAVQEGETVPAGATLFVVRSAPLADRTSELRTLQTQLAANGERLRIAASQYETRQRQDESEERRLASKVAFLKQIIASKQQRLDLIKELVDSSASGMRSGSINRLDVTRLQLEYTTVKEELQGADNDLDDATAAITRLKQDEEARDLEYREIKRGLEEDMTTERIRINSLQQDLANITDSGLVLVSPCAGTVLRLRVNAAGAVVKEGDILGELACEGDRMQAELVLAQAGLPQVHAGQGVKLRFDAFPYQRFGVQYGTVKWLGPSGGAGPDQGGFRALVELRRDSIRVKGVWRRLLPGMAGDGDIVVGRRSLVSYAFEPIRALKESFAEVPAQ